MLAVFAARSFGIRDVVLTGNLTAIKAIADVFEGLEQLFDIRFIIPERSQFATVIGAALCDKEEI
jgi:type II pantothenate kinase